MHVYYAMGGGLGHVSRGLAVANVLKWSPDQVVFLCSPGPGADLFYRYGFRFEVPDRSLALDQQAFRKWLRAVCARLKPDEIWIDCFPAGILGELGPDSFPDVRRLVLVSRILNSKALSALQLPLLPVYDVIQLVEPVSEAQQALFEGIAPLAALDLSGYYQPNGGLAGAAESSAVLEGLAFIQQQKRDGRAVWGIVHSGPLAEVHELVTYAKDTAALEGIDPAFLVCTVEVGAFEGVEFVSACFPARSLFPELDRIFSGCGFNLFQETWAFRSKHSFLPFARPYDDQFLRARHRRQGLAPVPV